jgi:amidase
MREMNRLGVSELARGLRARELGAADVVEACLERIAAREPAIHAWASIDFDYARSQARSLDAGPIRGPLHGVPVGVKDILDTADLPTEYGSPIYAGCRPRADAACVAAARAAGAIVLGKTATTEFACQSPAATVNPRDAARTPGGSSSGTAAGVADCMMPVGFGTQTAGSIVRPASYCGVVGYKPTFGTLARDGLKLVAESLDTIGVLTRSVADAAFFVGAIAARSVLEDLPPLDGLTIGFCRTREWSEVDPAVAERLESVAERLAAAGARLTRVELPPEFAALGDAHAVIQAYEGARNLAGELSAHRAELSAPLLEMLEQGARTTAERYAECRRLAAECRARLPAAMAGCHVLLTASATGEAPLGLASTGSPVMNRIWTLLHAPCVNVPATRGPGGLPVGVQIVGRVGDDATALAAAAWIEQRLE